LIEARNIGELLNMREPLADLSRCSLALTAADVDLSHHKAAYELTAVVAGVPAMPKL